MMVFHRDTPFAGFDFLGAVLLDVVNLIGGFLNLVPVVTLSSAPARAVLQQATGVRDAAALSLPELVVAARRPDVMQAAVAFNITELLGFDYVVKLAQAPWPRVVSNLVNGGLALVNNTWSLTLLITQGQGTVADIRFFQFGYITDWVRAAGTALGLVGVAFDDKLNYVLSDLGQIVANAVQIAGAHTILPFLFLLLLLLLFFMIAAGPIALGSARSHTASCDSQCAQRQRARGSAGRRPSAAAAAAAAPPPAGPRGAP